MITAAGVVKKYIKILLPCIEKKKTIAKHAVKALCKNPL